jgi:cholesterol transport system auxiliary component
MRTTATPRRRLFALGAGALAAGCLRRTPPPVRRFYLTALAEPPPDVPSASWSLVVPPPETVAALRTTRIAQALGANEFDFYADAEWGDIPPLMFQAVLIRSFERTGAIPVVVDQRARVRTDFILNGTLVPFFAVGAVGTPPTARVGFDARLVRSRGREVVATRSFEERREAESADVAAVVAAFDAAARAVMAALVPWTVTAGNTAGTGA